MCVYAVIVTGSGRQESISKKSKLGWNKQVNAAFPEAFGANLKRNIDEKNVLVCMFFFFLREFSHSKIASGLFMLFLPKTAMETH